MLTAGDPDPDVATTDRPAGSARPAAWSVEAVRDRLREAAETLQRMPPLTGRDRPARVRMASLERNFHRTLDEAFAEAVDEIATTGAQAAPRMRPAPPEPAAIDRMHEALGWLWWLNATQRRIVFAKAFGPHRSSVALARRFRCDRRTIARWHRASLGRIAKRLVAEGVPVRLAERNGGNQRFPHRSKKTA